MAFGALSAHEWTLEGLTITTSPPAATTIDVSEGPRRVPTWAKVGLAYWIAPAIPLGPRTPHGGSSAVTYVELDILTEQRIAARGDNQGRITSGVHRITVCEALPAAPIAKRSMRSGSAGVPSISITKTSWVELQALAARRSSGNPATPRGIYLA